ncbi:ADP-ribosylation factor-like protein 6-interacting protein 4 [Varanus komodoensis]|nr:ADP-ribosylation factor-like protein 6-interacting protein 4 [Varanus komodoensis]
MAHSQARKRSGSRSQSESQSRQDVEKKVKKKRRRSSKDSRSRKSPSPAGKRGPESQGPRMDSASAKEDSSAEESSEDECKSKRKKQSKKKMTKEKDKKRKKRKKKAKKKAKKKLKEKEKEGKTAGEELPGPSLEQWQKEAGADPGPALTDEQKSRIQAMKPMTKEEWDARQSVIRRVVDPETGRTRLIKGDGEVLEEIVTKERHKEINKACGSLVISERDKGWGVV